MIVFDRMVKVGDVVEGHWRWSDLYLRGRLI